MKENVIIKSYQNGITLILREEVPFQELLSEIAYKFHESGRFFGNAKMALALEGRVVTAEEGSGRGKKMGIHRKLCSCPKSFV